MQYGSRVDLHYGDFSRALQNSVLIVFLVYLKESVDVSLHILCRGGAQEGAMVNALCINNAA